MKLRKTMYSVLAAAVAVSGAVTGVAPAGAATTASSAAGSYQLDVGGDITTLTDGETAVYPMVPVTPTGQPRAMSPNADYDYGCGLLEVTASAGVFHYSITMHVPATNFVGHFSITDLTSGQSGGSVLELIWAGDIPTSKLHGHRYSGTLTGYATFAGVSVCSVGPNNTLYTYP